MHDVSLILIPHVERTKAFQMILYNDSLHKSYESYKFNKIFAIFEICSFIFPEAFDFVEDFVFSFDFVVVLSPMKPAQFAE